MRKFIAIAAAAALFTLPAFAAPVYVPGQGGAVGPNVACTNSDGATIRCIQPSVTLNDATGVAAGTAGNPLVTTPATGATSTVKIDQTTPGTTNGVQVNAALPAGTNNIGKVSGAGTVGVPDANALTVQGTTANAGTGNPAPVVVGMRSSTGGITTTLDSLTSASNLSGSTVAATGLAGDCDDTSQTLLTENNFGAVRMSCSNHSLIVRPYESAENSWSYAAAASGIVNTTTAVTIKTAAGAGLRNYLASCQLQSATLGGATELVFRDGAAGTVIFRTQLQTTALGLTSIKFETPLRGTANTLMEVATLTAVTGGVYVNCQGYAAP